MSEYRPIHSPFDCAHRRVGELPPMGTLHDLRPLRQSHRANGDRWDRAVQFRERRRHDQSHRRTRLRCQRQHDQRRQQHPRLRRRKSRPQRHQRQHLRHVRLRRRRIARDESGGGTTTVYIFAGSKVIAEYDNGAAVASPSREYIYSGGVPLVKIDSGGLTYYHADHLSARLLTDSSGSILGQQGHFPFGEIWYETGTTSKFKFTTYERDAESGNDYAMARFHVNRLGRFSSPDALAGSNVNPQSLNRYSYVGNDPIRLIDPSGMLCEDTNGQQDPSCQSGENFIQNN